MNLQAFLSAHNPRQTLNRFVAQGLMGHKDEGAERAFVQKAIEAGLVEPVDTRRLRWPEAWAGTKLTDTGEASLMAFWQDEALTA